MEPKHKPKSKTQNLLVEVSEQEVVIEFSPNLKCRTTIHLKSLTPTASVAFKVQTSSPHKFLVNPPAGIIPPLSSAAFQVILKPQTHLPNAFPRSPADRFLVKTALFPDPPRHHNLRDAHAPASVISWFASRPGNCPTDDHRLKTAFVGAFLLRHAVGSGNYDAARGLVKRRGSVLSELGFGESDALLRAASELANPERMVNLLMESGLRIGGSGGGDDVEDGRTELHSVAASGDCHVAQRLLDSGADPTVLDYRGRTAIDLARDTGHSKVVEILERGEAVLTAARNGDLKQLKWLIKTKAATEFSDQYGLTALHTAAMKGHNEAVSVLIEAGLDVESRDKEGYSPLHLAMLGGSLEAASALVSKGANVNAKSTSNLAPLHLATAMGHHHIAEFLITKGASSSI